MHLQGTPTFIPRIRWVDSATEAPASSVAGPAFGYFGGGENPSPDYTVIKNEIGLDYSVMIQQQFVLRKVRYHVDRS